MATVKHDRNSKLIDGAYLYDFGLCTPGDGERDRTPPDRREVEACKDWLRRNAAPRKTMNRYSNSYGLKHVVEHFVACPYPYVTNGALILAAIEVGYRCKRIRDTPNALFNMKFAEAS